MEPNVIIVQAGGKGSRMGKLTRNKPKALVPIDNLPMLFHLFKQYPDKRFLIITDYHADALERYLAAFAEVDYTTVRASGHSGTCAGLSDAMKLVPPDEPFLLIWCDLVLPNEHCICCDTGNAIGLSTGFRCRWRYTGGTFEEHESLNQGVAGYFIFRSKEMLDGVPNDGEFVRWLQEQDFVFDTEVPLVGAREFGLLSEWEKLPVSRCRPFNKLIEKDNLLIKLPVDSQGKQLAKRESAWYRKAQELGFNNIPTIYNLQPITMEVIEGRNVYDCQDLHPEEKRALLHQIIDCLEAVHALGSIPADTESYRNAYIGKTFARLEKVRDLVPFARDPSMIVNGRSCRNVFDSKSEIESLVMEYAPDHFQFIHGDCTFSNIMLKPDGLPVLIDPRGYFGTTELFGDPAYDWVKLYYSLLSDYDQFNLKRFDLEISTREIRLDIASNGWSFLERDFFNALSGKVDERQMKLLLAITWLSLTTYAWEDYDSICGAFYNGAYYLEEALTV